MTKYNIKTFRAKMAQAFDEADNKEVLIERSRRPGKKLYSLRRKYEKTEESPRTELEKS